MLWETFSSKGIGSLHHIEGGINLFLDKNWTTTSFPQRKTLKMSLVMGLSARQ
uniref:Uncharacterized protein n=1 Tax=Lepeophtheirus salmonis TaxID=72036 RepID=A0A0K2UJZ4_LEPSM